MKKILFLAIVAFSSQLFSAELDCNIKLNQEIISKAKVSTVLDKRVVINSESGIFAYVTEKSSQQYVVEAYLSDYDLRIYGEGSLKDNHDRLIASAWGQTSIVDIGCELSK